MAVTISGSSGVTYPAGGLDNVAGAGVGTTDTQTLTNKTLGSGLTMGASALTSGTAWTYTSGTPASIDFTGIPSWVKQITMTISNLKFAALGVARIQVGSGSLATTGYDTGSLMAFNTTPAIATTGLSVAPQGIAGFSANNSSTLVFGTYTITNTTGNLWVCSGMNHRAGDSTATISNNSITLGGVLDRISLVATTSTFAGGTVNITYA